MNYITGDIIFVKSNTYFFVNHNGIVLEENGEKYIYHNTPDYENGFGGSINVEKLSTWLEGREVIRVERTNVSAERIKSVVAELRDIKYNFITFNCEHFTESVVHNRYSSNQINTWVFLFLFYRLAINSK